MFVSMCACVLACTHPPSAEPHSSSPPGTAALGISAVPARL